VTPRRAQPQDATRRAIAARDAGLRRISSANRWLVTAAIGLSAFFTAVVAIAKPGKAHKGATTAAAPAAAGSNSAAGDPNAAASASNANAGAAPGDPGVAASAGVQPGDPNAAAATGDPNALQQPSQAPLPDPSQQPVIVSGGS
jgi:hypothetical protein